MLDAKDIEIIRSIVADAVNTSVHAAVQEAVPVAVQEALQEASKDIIREAVEQSRQNMMLLYENKIEPNFRLLAEGHAAILERFEPRMTEAERRLDDLETDVLVLKTSL